MFWAYESYYHLHLVFDAGLQLFYVAMSVYGVYRWLYGGVDGTAKPITSMSSLEHAVAIASGTALSALLLFSSRYFDQLNFQFLDATTTAFLVVGTYYLIERKLESWVYLVICDVIYIYIYSQVGAYLFVGIMVLYIGFGIAGYRSWRNLMDSSPMPS